MSDGHLNICISCTKKRISEREKKLRENPEWVEKEKERGRKEEVVLPTEYTSHIYEKYQSALKTQAMVNSSIERARQIEREYLHMACNGTHTINGLNKKTSTKICTWRDQYKAPYQEALKKYTEILGQMKQKADDIKRELTIKQQEALERYKAQEVIRQQEALDQDQQEADDQQEAMERQALSKVNNAFTRKKQKDPESDDRDLEAGTAEVLVIHA